METFIVFLYFGMFGWFASLITCSSVAPGEKLLFYMEKSAQAGFYTGLLAVFIMLLVRFLDGLTF